MIILFVNDKFFVINKYDIKTDLWCKIPFFVHGFLCVFAFKRRSDGLDSNEEIHHIYDLKYNVSTVLGHS